MDRNTNSNPLVWAEGGCCEDWWHNVEKRDSFFLDESYSGNFKGIKINANRANGLYGGSNTIQPNSIRITYLIKFVE